MENSYFFYGHYSGTFRFKFHAFEFDFPLAYFLVICGIFLTNLTYIVYSSAKSVKQQITRNIDREDGALGIFPAIFSSWDFSVSEKESIEIQKNDIQGKKK